MSCFTPLFKLVNKINPSCHLAALQIELRETLNVAGPRSVVVSVQDCYAGDPGLIPGPSKGDHQSHHHEVMAHLRGYSHQGWMSSLVCSWLGG